MSFRLAALFATWLVASLAAGIASTILGFVEGVTGDGSMLGVLDATGGWLLGTLAPAGVILTFFFVPIVALLEWRGVRSLLPYVIGGGVSGALAVAVFAWPQAYGGWLWILVLPGFLAGATWWFLIIRPRPGEISSIGS